MHVPRPVREEEAQRFSCTVVYISRDHDQLQSMIDAVMLSTAGTLPPTWATSFSGELEVSLALFNFAVPSYTSG